MANSQEDSGAASDDPDLLAAVVLHTLVSSAGQAQSLAEIVKACERDPASTHDRKAVETAITSLLDDGLAIAGGGGFAATRAALRAAELSF